MALNKNIVCSNGATFFGESGSGSQNTISGPVSVVTGGTVTFNGSGGSLTFSSPISITNGTLTVSGGAPVFAGGLTNFSGAVNLSGSALVSGPVSIPSGSTLTCSGSPTFSGLVNIASGSTLQFNGNYYNTITFSNTVSGSGGFGIQYQSYVNFAASNTFTGNITVPQCNSGSGSAIRLIGNGSISQVPLINLQGIASGAEAAGIWP